MGAGLTGHSNLYLDNTPVIPFHIYKTGVEVTCPVISTCYTDKMQQMETCIGGDPISDAI